jgi:DNA invertase Pin-like site-specific DNA recombinase
MEKTLESEAPKPKAVGYCRVSSKKQAEDGGSLEAQRDAIIREAVLGGFDLLDVFADGGISGGKGEKSRPGLSSALDAIRSGKAEALIVKHADRLARDSDLAGHFRVTVQDAGGRLVVIDEAKDDPIRRAVDKMLAELERIRGSQRMKAWNAARKAKGLPAGPAPFGSEKGQDSRLRPIAAETRIVGRIIVMKAKGLSLRAIAAKLNAEGVTMRGREWSAQQVLLVFRRAQAAA